MLNVIPNTVRLSFADFDGYCHVNIHNLHNQDLITTETLTGAAHWLELLEYKWRIGSNGIWERTG